MQPEGAASAAVSAAPDSAGTSAQAGAARSGARKAREKTATSSMKAAEPAKTKPGRLRAEAANGRASAGHVGARLRASREAAGMSLRQFARELGVSPSFVSQLENGKTQPSVATLYMICSALDLSIDELFSTEEARPAAPAPTHASRTPSPAVEPWSNPGLASHGAHPGESPLVRPAERRILALDSGVHWERLSALHEAAIDFMFVRYEVGGSSTPDERLTRHMGTEYGYVINGLLEISLGFETYRIGPGDAISFDSSTPHRLTNVGNIPVEAIWFVHGRNTVHEH